MTNNLNEQIDIAEKLARIAHGGQTRRGGKPYITHPEAVANSVEPKYKVVAWLHDVLEDTEFTASDLLLLNFKPDDVHALILLDKTKQSNYDTYLKNIKRNDKARVIKIADIKHNLSDKPKPKTKERYINALNFLI
jgi:(p)ppGpp synthase/HD superfamily hydrolase